MQRCVNLVDLEKMLKNAYLDAKIGFDTEENSRPPKFFNFSISSYRPDGITNFHIRTTPGSLRKCFYFTEPNADEIMTPPTSGSNPQPPIIILIIIDNWGGYPQFFPSIFEISGDFDSF